MSLLGLEEPDAPAERLATLLNAGSCLIAAQSEEASLSMRCGKHPQDESLFREWAQARQRVEECQEKYTDSLEKCGHRGLIVASPTM
jgi:hypothetical protein